MVAGNPNVKLHFPSKIYMILESESNDVIRWENSGDGVFRIVDPVRFEREIIPKWFRHNRFSSVQRQLNLYGFKCIQKGDLKGCFFHPSFKRGNWTEIRSIKRFNPSSKKAGEESRDEDNFCHEDAAISCSSDSDMDGLNDCDVPTFDSFTSTDDFLLSRPSSDNTVISIKRSDSLEDLTNMCAVLEDFYMQNHSKCSVDKSLDFPVVSY